MEASRLELPGGGQFDTLAPAYDAWYDTPLGRVVDRLESGAVLGLVGEGPGAWALDLSCGTGRYALALARRGLRGVGGGISAPLLLGGGGRRGGGRPPRGRGRGGSRDASWRSATVSWCRAGAS